MIVYIVEVGYNKLYKKTVKQQIDILQNYESPHKFQNSWLRQLYNSLRHYISISSGITISSVITIYNYLSSPTDIQFATFASNASKQAILSSLATTGLLYTMIPIARPNKHNDGIAFITGKGNRFFPKKGNVDDQNPKKIAININYKDLDPVIDDIAERYNGQILEKNVENVQPSSHKQTETFRLLTYAFSQKDKNQIQENIKRFLYSLPINIFVKHIYKIDFEDATNTNDTNNVLQKIKESMSSKDKSDLIIYPSKTEFDNNLDTKINEYATIHTTNYNKINDNVKYLADYIKPLKYFKRVLPGLFPHEFSPMK